MPARRGRLPGRVHPDWRLCAALEVVLDGGHTLLVTDSEDTLSWVRDQHDGWGVGLYPPDASDTGGECLVFDSTTDGSPAALPPLIGDVLDQYLRRRTA